MDFWLLIWRPVDWGSARKTGIEMIGEKSSLVTVLLYFFTLAVFRAAPGRLEEAS